MFGDSIDTTNPASVYTTVSNSVALTPYIGSLAAPYPTNEWWNNLILDDGQGTFVQLPYHLKSLPEGLNVCFPARTVAATNIVTAMLENISFRTSEQLSQKKVDIGEKLYTKVKYRKAKHSNPGAPSVAVNATSGNLNGSYTYKVTFVDGSTETQGGTASSAATPANERVDLSSIPTGGSGVTARKIYRSKGGGTYRFVATINDNSTTTYTDNIADATVNAAAIIPADNTTLDSDAAKFMDFTIIKGDPFITANYSGMTPLIRTQHAITDVNGSGTPGAVTATRFEVTLNNGQKWILYASSSIELTWSNETSHWQLLASATFTGTIRAAYCSDSSYETILDTAATCIATAGTVSATWPSATEARLTFTWTTTGTGTLLMLALPHHQRLLLSPAYASPAMYYQTMKGQARGVLGNNWTLVYNTDFPTWYATNAIDPAKIATIQSQLNVDKSKTVVSPDPYFGGKQLQAIAYMATIADQVNENDAASTLRATAKTALNSWLNATNLDPLATPTDKPQYRYDTTWKGIVTKGGAANISEYFGEGAYNDHHFHRGYHVGAAAHIAKGDSAWATTYKTKVNMVLRDYANPSTADTYFPRFRNKDFFDGHSWAHGITTWGDGKNQESISEAINAYYQMMLWGIAISDTNIRDHGKLLLAMEIESGDEYWRINASESIYESTFEAGKVVGVLSAAKVEYQTFFGSNVEYIHEIQSLPYTPITEKYLKTSWVSESYPVVATALTRNATATAIMSGNTVTSISVTNGGGGYETPPTVTISGGGGSGATATASLTNGAVSSIAVTNGGSGYTSTPTVSIAASPLTLADGWRGFIYAKQALIDLEASWSNILSLNNWDDGMSKSIAMYWNATRSASPSTPTPPTVTQPNYENNILVSKFKQVKNNARAYVADNSWNNTNAEITFSLDTVAHGSRFPEIDIANGLNTFWITKYRDNLYSNPGDDPQMEIAEVIARSGGTFTVQRNKLGTQAVATTGKPAIRMLMVDQHLKDIHEAINKLQRSNTPTPTSFRMFNGALQKKDPGSDTWSPFTVKGLNYNPTPPGFNPDRGRIFDPMANAQQAKWFCENFKAVGGNAARIYYNGEPQIFDLDASGLASGGSDMYQTLKTLDIFYANGIYVLFNIFVRFYPAYNTGAEREWYKNKTASDMIEIVHITKNHPAIMGYIFGNETNLVKNGQYQNLGPGVVTINEWWSFANTVAGEAKNLDPNHIFVICSGLGAPQAISDAVAAENSGALSNFDLHGANIYRGNGWNQPSNGANFWTQWNPTNNKRILVTEVGTDSYDTDTGTQDEDNQVTNITALWNNRDTTKCVGICFFEAFDELWKAGEDGGTNPTNDGNYTDSYYFADNDGFYITPDFKGNEQHFGWWRYITATPYMVPPTPKKIVSSIRNIWGP